MTYVTDDGIMSGIPEDDWVAQRGNPDYYLNPDEPVEEPVAYDFPAKPF